MNQFKATLFFFYILASIAAVGTAFSHFWKANSLLSKEKNHLTVRSDKPAPASASESIDPLPVQ